MAVTGLINRTTLSAALTAFKTKIETVMQSMIGALDGTNIPLSSSDDTPIATAIANSVSKQTEVQTYSFTGHGIQFYAYKVGRVCNLCAVSGTTPALSTGTTLVTLQTEIRPVQQLNIADVGNSSNRIMINTNGAVVINVAYPSGSYSRWSTTYVTAT